MKIIRFNVGGVPTDIPRIETDDPSKGPYPARFEGIPGQPPNRAIFELPDDANGGGHLFWGDKSANFLLPPASWQNEATLLGLGPLVYSLVTKKPQRLRSDGWGFTKEDGSRWIAALHSDFRLFHMWLHNDRGSVESVLDQRQEAGGEGPRVFGSCNFLFDLNPSNYPNYYDELRPFADYLLNRGMYWELTVFTYPYSNDRQAHWQRTNAALEGSVNTIIELGNENEKNGVNSDEFRKASSLLTSTGSYCDGWETTGEWGDYVTFHPRRDWKWGFTVAPTINELREYPGQRKPILINEPIGAAEYNEHGRRSTDAAQFERMAVDCALWGAGGVFHSQSGLDSSLWGPIQYECAKSFFRGLQR